MTEVVLTRAELPGIRGLIGEDVGSVFDRDPAARTRFEIRMLEQEVGVHGCLPGGTEAGDECRQCDALQVCEPPDQRGLPARASPRPAEA